MKRIALSLVVLVSDVLSETVVIRPELLESRSVEGYAPNQPAAAIRPKEIYDGLCDHFIGYGLYTTISCANRCRAMFARKNGLKTAAQQERELLAEQGMQPAAEDPGLKKVYDTYENPMNVSTLAFNQIIVTLAPSCVFQSYKFAKGPNPNIPIDIQRKGFAKGGLSKSYHLGAVDNCWTNVCYNPPENLTALAPVMQGATLTFARSPAHCQFLCQQQGSGCDAFTYDTLPQAMALGLAPEDHTVRASPEGHGSCILWAKHHAKKYGNKIKTTTSPMHKCSLERNPDITASNGCQVCEGVRTVSYYQNRWIAGTAYCLVGNGRQTMCNLASDIPDVSPFGQWKTELSKDVEAQVIANAQKIRWRIKGDDEWHTALKTEGL